MPFIERQYYEFVHQWLADTESCAKAEQRLKTLSLLSADVVGRRERDGQVIACEAPRLG